MSDEFYMIDKRYWINVGLIISSIAIIFAQLYVASTIDWNNFDSFSTIITFTDLFILLCFEIGIGIVGLSYDFSDKRPVYKRQNIQKVKKQ